MICALGDEALEYVYASVYKELQTLVDNNQLLNLKSLLQNQYNSLAEEVGHELALEAVHIMPMYALQAMVDDSEFLSYFKDNFNEISETATLFQDPTKIVEYLESTLTPVQIAVNRSKIDAAVPTNKRVEAVEPPKEVTKASDRPETPNVTYFWEASYGNVNSEGFYAYGLLRKLSSEFPGNPDFTTLTYNGHTGFRLKMVTSEELEKSNDLYEQDKDFKEKNPEEFNKAANVVVTDNEGNTLYFDENYNISKEKKEGYKAIYFKTRKPVKDTDGNWTHTSLKKEIKEGKEFDVIVDGVRQRASTIQTPKEIAHSKKINSKEASKYIQDEYNKLVELQNKLLESGKAILLDIEYLSEGFPIVNLGEKSKTQLKDVDFSETYQGYALTEVKRGVYQITLTNPNKQDNITVRQNKLTQAQQNIISELLFNPALSNPRKLGKNKVLNAKERHEILTTLVGDQLYFKYDYNSKEVLPTNIRLVTNVKGKNVAEINVTPEYLKDSFFNSPLGDGEVVDGVTKNQKNRINILSSFIGKNISAPIKVENNEITMETMSYDDFIIQNAYTTNETLNYKGKKVIFRKHPYFKFTPSDQAIQEETKEINETAGTMTQTTPYGTTAGPILTTSTAQQTNEVEIIYSPIDMSGYGKSYKQADISKGGKSIVFNTHQNTIRKDNNGVIELSIDDVDGKTFYPISVDLSKTAEYADYKKKLDILNAERKRLKEAGEKGVEDMLRGMGASMSVAKKQLLELIATELKKKNRVAPYKGGELSKPTQQTNEVKAKTKFTPNPFTETEVDPDELMRSKKLDSGVTKEQIEKAQKWYESSDINKLLGYKQAFNIVNSDAYATFSSAGITLFNGSNFTDLYHESWHAFSQLFLTVGDKTKLYNEVSKLSGSFTNHNGQQVKFKDASYLEIEEFLAEDFRSYMLSDGTKVFKGRTATNNIFKRILNFLKNFFKGTKAIDYSTINTQNSVKELYDKLRVGNLNEYNASVSNMMFGKLNKGKIIAPSSANINLSKDETKQVMSMFDSMMSEYLDLKNKMNDTNKFTTQFFKSSAIRNNAYANAYNSLLDKYNNKNYPEDATGRTQEIFEQVLNNFKLIADHHLANSIFGNNISSKESKKEKLAENIDEEVADKDLGVELLSKSNVDPSNYRTDIIDYLMSTLPFVDSEGNFRLDRFGVPMLADSFQVSTLLTNLLTDTRGIDAMYEVLDSYAKSTKPYSNIVNILLARLGNTKDINISTAATWFEFHKSFGLNSTPVSVTLNRKHKNDDGIVTHDLIHKHNDAIVDKTVNNLDNAFKTADPSKHMIIKDPRYGNILDLEAIYDKYRKFSPQHGEHKVDFIEGTRIVGFLTDIGFDLSDIGYNSELAKELREATQGKGDSKLNLNFLLRSLVKSHENNLKKKEKAEKEGTDYEPKMYRSLSEIFSDDNKHLKSIAKIIAKNSPTVSVAMVPDASNNPVYTNKTFSTQTVMINLLNSVEHVDQLNGKHQTVDTIEELHHLGPDYAWASASMTKRAMFDTSGKRRKDSSIESKELLGVSNTAESVHENGEKTNKLTQGDKLIENMNYLLLKGASEQMRYGTKSTATAVVIRNVNDSNQDKYLYIDLENFKEANLSIANEQFTAMVIPFIDAEIARMIEFNKKDSPYSNISNSSNFYENGKDFVLFDKILSDETKETIKNYYNISDPSTEIVTLEQSMNSGVLDNSELAAIRDMIYNDLSLFMSKAVDLDMNDFNKMPYISDNLRQKIELRTGAKGHVAKNLAVKAFSYNYVLRNLDMLGLLYGDPAQFNMAKEDFHKRIGAIASGGVQFSNDVSTNEFVNTSVGRPLAESKGFTKSTSWDGKLRTSVIADNNVRSTAYDAMFKTLTEDFGYSKVDTERRLEAYLKMTEGDAQGYMSLDTYRTLSIISGKWDWNKQETLFQKIVNKEDINTDDVVKYFPPRKYQYYGPLANNLDPASNRSISLQAFHKYSLLPLIPGVFGENADKLHDQMMEQGIDYTIFESASKINSVTSNGKPDVIYKDFDNSRELKETLPFTVNEIFLAYLKDQTDVNEKYKGKTTLPTQMRKLVTIGMFDGGDSTSEENKVLAEKYQSLLDALVAKNKEDLIEELGLEYTTNEDGVKTFSKKGLENLTNAIQTELSERDLGDNELEFIQVDKNGNLKVDLSFSPSAEKIETALVSLANKRIVKPKVAGEPLIQASSSILTDNDMPRNATKAEKEEYGTNGLKFYSYDPKTGTKAMQVKISMQGKFKHLLLRADVLKKAKDENISTLKALNLLIEDKEWISENKEILTMVGVRIPTQGLNSMDVMEIAEFLPTHAGNIIIAPSEIVAKTGSDFDVDKMFIMMPSLMNLDGKTHKYKYDKSIKDSTQSLKNNLSELIEKQKELYETLYNEVTPEVIAAKSEIYNEFKESISDLNSKVKLAKEELELLKLRSVTENVNDEIAYVENNIEKLNDHITNLLSDRNELFELDATEKTQKIKEDIANTKEEINKVKLNLANSSAAAIQTSLVDVLTDILLKPDNFANLITSIDGDTVKNKANELGKFMSYNSSQSLIDQDHAKKGIHAFQILLSSYNLDKHRKNNEGMATLGQAAIDLTFKSEFNRIGFHLNPYMMLDTKDKDGEIIKTQSDIALNLLLPHNVAKNGGIDLSRLKDTEGEDIFYILNLLINGWVDIEKDAWIFNVQGNKKVEPTLVMLVMAGVPFDKAADFVSNPYVKEYVESQNYYESLFVEAHEGSNFTQGNPKIKALNDILKKYDSDNFKTEKLKNPAYDTDFLKQIQDRRKELIGENAIKTSSLVSINVESLSEKDKKDAFGAFLHFIELQNIAEDLTQLKLHMNYDTTVSRTLYDIHQKEANIPSLRTGKIYAEEFVDSLLEGSPIGTFNISDFQSDLWSQVLILRNDKTLNDKIKSITSDPGFQTTLRETFGKGNQAKYVEAYRNNLIKYLLQNSLLESRSKDFYKSLATKTSLTKKEISNLKYGAAVLDKVLYISKDKIREQYKRKDFTNASEYFKLGLAPVPLFTFTHEGKNSEQEYENFVIEREYLRHSMPINEVMGTPMFEEYKNSPEEADNNFLHLLPGDNIENKINLLTYERIIRDMALSNIFNINSLFSSKTNTVADQFLRITKMYPELAEEYAVFTQFKELPTLNSDVKNIGPITSKPKGELVERVSENIKELQNHKDIFVRDFFTKLPMYAFLQSGHNTKSMNSILRYMPQGDFVQMLSNQINDVKVTTKILNSYTAKFNKVNRVDNKIRYKIQDYTVPNEKDDHISQINVIEISAYKGVPVKYSNNIRSKQNTRIAAKYSEGVILLDKELLLEGFSKKAWTSPRNLFETIHGEKINSKADALAPDTFTTYEEWQNFVIEHEYQHTLYTRKDFDNEFPGSTLGHYESVINQRALEALSTAEVESIPTTLVEDNNNYTVVPLAVENAFQIVRPDFTEEVENSVPKAELFESTPELANEVYEAAGFKSNLPSVLDYKIGKIYNTQGKEIFAGVVDGQVYINKELLDKYSNKEVLDNQLPILNTVLKNLNVYDRLVNGSKEQLVRFLVEHEKAHLDFEREGRKFKNEEVEEVYANGKALITIGILKSKDFDISGSNEAVIRLSKYFPTKEEYIDDMVELVAKAMDNATVDLSTITGYEVDVFKGSLWGKKLQTSSMDNFFFLQGKDGYPKNKGELKEAISKDIARNIPRSIKEKYWKEILKSLPDDEKALLSNWAYYNNIKFYTSQYGKPYFDFNKEKYPELNKEDKEKYTNWDSFISGIIGSFTGAGSDLWFANNLLADEEGSIIDWYKNLTPEKLDENIKNLSRAMAFKSMVVSSFERGSSISALDQNARKVESIKEAYYEIKQRTEVSPPQLTSTSLSQEITPQQKQEAQEKFQEYVNATGRQDIEGFKDFVNKPKQQATEVDKVTDEQIIKNNQSTTFVTEEATSFNNTYPMHIKNMGESLGEENFDYNKTLIDNIVSDLKELTEKGNPVSFFENYGVSLKNSAPKTYKYLNEQLAENFRLSNDPSNETKEVMPNILPREISDEVIQKGIQNEIQDAMDSLNNCKK